MARKFFTSFSDELQARVEIEDCIKRFARACDRQDWELASTLFHHDAIDNHGSFKGSAKDFLVQLQSSGSKLDHAMHLVSNMLIEFKSASKAYVETYYVVHHRLRPTAEAKFGVRRQTLARSLDHFEHRDGEWRSSSRTIVYGDVEEIPMTEPLKLPSGFIEQKRTREDLLYTSRDV